MLAHNEQFTPMEFAAFDCRLGEDQKPHLNELYNGGLTASEGARPFLAERSFDLIQGKYAVNNPILVEIYGLPFKINLPAGNNFELINDRVEPAIGYLRDIQDQAFKAQLDKEVLQQVLIELKKLDLKDIKNLVEAALNAKDTEFQNAYQNLANKIKANFATSENEILAQEVINAANAFVNNADLKSCVIYLPNSFRKDCQLVESVVPQVAEVKNEEKPRAKSTMQVLSELGSSREQALCAGLMGGLGKYFEVADYGKLRALDLHKFNDIVYNAILLHETNPVYKDKNRHSFGEIRAFHDYIEKSAASFLRLRKEYDFYQDITLQSIQSQIDALQDSKSPEKNALTKRLYELKQHVHELFEHMGDESGRTKTMAAIKGLQADLQLSTLREVQDVAVVVSKVAGYIEQVLEVVQNDLQQTITRTKAAGEMKQPVADRVSAVEDSKEVAQDSDRLSHKH